MSIAAATRQAYAREVEEKHTDFTEAAAQPEVTSAIERVTQWIPTEAVATYVGLLGLFNAKSVTTRWILLGVGIALVVIFLALNSALVNKRGAEAWLAHGKQGNPPKLAGKRIGALLAISLVAFLAWACALPETPFLDWWSDATILGGAAVLVLAGIIPKAAELLGVNMPTPDE